MHVHMNYGGAYVNDPARLRAQAEAEDLHVVEDLIVNKEQRIPDMGRFSPDLDPVSTATTLVKHDEEYHTSWWGHTGHLGLKDHLILPIYAGYANTAAWSLFPDNSTIIDLAHAQGGISGYVHPLDPPAPDPAGADPLTYALPVDVALGKADYVEVVGFSDHQTTAGVWYRLLNTGLRLPTGSGTDAMANYASLRGPVGMNRVFARSGAKLDYRAWLAAIKAGRTFATNGPLLAFTLDGHEVGDEIALPAGGRDAGGEGEPALDRPGREARDRLERRRSSRPFRSRRAGRARTRRSPCPCRRAAGTRCGPGRRMPSSRSSTSIPSRRRARSTSSWAARRFAAPTTRSTSSPGSRASRRPPRRTAAGTTRRKRRRCSSASPPRRRCFRERGGAVGRRPLPAALCAAFPSGASRPHRTRWAEAGGDKPTSSGRPSAVAQRRP